MASECEAFNSVANSRKRSLQEVDPDSNPSSKRLRWQPATHIPTPSPSASFTNKQSSGDYIARTRLSEGPPQSEPNPRKRAFEPSVADCAPTSKRRRQSHTSIYEWLDDTKAKASNKKEEPQDSTIISSIEVPLSLQGSVALWEAVDDPMSQQDGDSQSASTVSAQTERLDPNSSAYWGTLKRNGVVLDQAGLHIPEEVKKLIDGHIRKQRTSPRLGDQDQAKIKNLVIKVWHKAETTVSTIIKSPLFDLDYPDLAEGGNTLWTKQPLPSKAKATFPILIPKPDKHFGFSPVVESEWSDEQLGVAEHPFARPYSQPSRENMFPCLIFELKSEATKASLYAAEALAAGAGAHRVASLLWLLDVVEPDRERASTDALVFSSVVSQRQAVAYVHFYHPQDQTYYMSFVDTFYFVKDTDAQGCRDHHKNVAEWMLNVLKPIVRDLLTKAHPISKAWKKGRSASEDGRLSKSQRTEPETDTQAQPNLG